MTVFRNRKLRFLLLNSSIRSMLSQDLGPFHLDLEPNHVNVAAAGVSAVEQFRWRQMLDFYTCTECGRCQDVCPAYASGSPLSPKLLMMDLRANLEARGDAWRRQAHDGAGNGAAGILAVPLVGDVITEQTLWACTTCYACDQECPLFIEHIAPIVDMRRHLVYEGQMDDKLQEALANVAKHAHASLVMVELSHLHDRVVLNIQDDGAGFDSEKIGGIPGHGLSNMAVRCRLLGGELTVSSAPGRGTRVRAVVPAQPTSQVTPSLVTFP